MQSSIKTNVERMSSEELIGYLGAALIREGEAEILRTSYLNPNKDQIPAYSVPLQTGEFKTQLAGMLEKVQERQEVFLLENGLSTYFMLKESKAKDIASQLPMDKLLDHGIAEGTRLSKEMDKLFANDAKIDVSVRNSSEQLEKLANRFGATFANGADEVSVENGKDQSKGIKM